MKRSCRSISAVSPVVAVILLLAITVVLASLVYIMVNQYILGIQRPAPMMMLQRQLGSNSSEDIIKVVGTSGESYGHHNYAVVLLVNGTVDEASRMNPLFIGSKGNITFNDWDDRLNLGDQFTVRVFPQTRYELAVLWRESGSLSGEVEWQTP